MKIAFPAKTSFNYLVDSSSEINESAPLADQGDLDAKMM
jgi:hypothetical protein